MSVTKEDLKKAENVARSYGATRLILFGSAQHNPESAHDLDLAVGGVEGWNFWKLGAEIEEEISVPLDLIPLKSGNAFCQHVEKWGEVLFED